MMNNFYIWGAVCFLSVILGFVHYNAGYNAEINKQNKYYKFLEFFRMTLNYFVALIVAYYFIAIRWPHVHNGESLSGSDFVLGAVFLMGLFGWLPYFIKNITEGINALISKLLN